MKILIACEESQRVCKEFRKMGHIAYSCDIQECSGGMPEWHIKDDVTRLLNGHCAFVTQNGTTHAIRGKWDLIIAFPPCTYLTVANNRAFSLNKNTRDYVVEKLEKRKEAYEFFMKFVNADCEKICIENPVGYMNTHYRKPDQIIHPYYFAKSKNDTKNYVMKRTCLWLKGLPPLKRTNDLPKPDPIYIRSNGKKVNWVESLTSSGGQKERAKARSKTFESVAKAMAEQYGKD